MIRMLTLSLVAMSAISSLAVTAIAAEPPADRVIAMYFHRTERCPTCQKMGSYSEEAIKTGFPEQLKTGTVEFRMIDFENKENEKLAEAYKVKGPALVIAKVADNKVKKFQDLEEIWGKVSKKPEFIKYVQSNIQAYME